MEVLYRKWRPQTLTSLVGQDAVTRTLLNALAAGSVSHAYLFCGPRGTGKTSTARILAKALNCTTTGGKGEPCNTCEMCRSVAEGRALDIIEIDAASNRGIDDIRELRERVGYAPNMARRKVYIIDEVHMLSKDACNALLKTLEEPPPHAVFILATTEAHKILPTIISRCQRFDFRRISQADVINKLSEIATGENIKVGPETLRLIARATTGSLRDAENLLQQLITFYGTDITLAQAQSTLGMTGDARARDMVKHILARDIAAGIATIHSVDRDGLDMRHLNRELVEYLRALLMIKVGSKDAVDLTKEDFEDLEKVAGSAQLAPILYAVKAFGELESRLDGNSTLPMELAFVDCVLQDIKPAEAAPPKPARAPRVEKHAAVEPEVKAAAIISPPASASPVPLAPVTTPPVAAEKPAATVVPAAEVKHEIKASSAPVTEAAAKSVTPVTSPSPTGVIPPAVPASEIDRLRQTWPQIARDLPAEVTAGVPAGTMRSVASLLNMARLKAIEGDTLVLAFGNEIFRTKIDQIENKKIIEKVFTYRLGRPARVQTVLETETAKKTDHMIDAVKKLGGVRVNPEDR